SRGPILSNGSTVRRFINGLNRRRFPKSRSNTGSWFLHYLSPGPLAFLYLLFLLFLLLRFLMLTRILLAAPLSIALLACNPIENTKDGKDSDGDVRANHYATPLDYSLEEPDCFGKDQSFKLGSYKI